MKFDPKTAFERCDTLMLDMDGTILDLAFDNFLWLHHVPEKYAEEHGVEPEEARKRLYAKFEEMMGQLQWYCLDHWSDFLKLDVAEIHRDLNERIGYLPGAEDFLKTLAEHDLRVIMVTNSHLEVLDIKDEVTGVKAHFDHIYSSHSFGQPKERQEFWHALREVEDFDPATTLFVDDTHRVLDSAKEYGVEMLLEVSHPDTSKEPRESGNYVTIKRLGDMLDRG